MATKKPKKSEKVLVDRLKLKLLLFAILCCIEGKAKAKLTGFFSPAELKKMKRYSDPTVDEFMIKGLSGLYRTLGGGRISKSSMDMVKRYAKAFGLKIKK